MMSDSVGIQDIEAGRRAGNVYAFSVITYGQGVQPVLFPVLKISGTSRSILRVAEIQEASVGEQTRCIRLFVNRRSADVLQSETREPSRLRQNFACLFVGH